MNCMLHITICEVLLASGLFISGFTQITEEYFDTITVDDPRKETACQDFADYGAAYEFKIIDGKVFYKRNGEFKGEFKPDEESNGKYVDNKTSRSAGRLDIIQLTMIAARDNRVMAYSAASKQLFWASLVTEYDKDYQGDTTIDGKKQRKWYSEDACYGKIDPEEATAATNPPFYPNPHFFYTLNTYRNELKLDTIPDLKRLGLKLGGKMPDLSVLSTDNSMAQTNYYDCFGKNNNISLPAGAVFKDVMQVMVKPKVWQLIDATPPRNSIDLSYYPFMGDSVKYRDSIYNYNKKRVFHELTGLVTKVVNRLLTITPADSNVSTNDEMLRNIMSDLVRHVVDSIQYSHKAVILKINTDQVKQNIMRINVKSLADAIIKFYDKNIDYAVVHYNDMALGVNGNPYVTFNISKQKSLEYCREYAAKNYLENSGNYLKNDLWDCLSVLDDSLGLYHDIVGKKIHDWSDNLADSLIYSLVNFRSEKIIPGFPEGYFSSGATTKRWVDIAKGLHSWYENYGDPQKYFLMKDTALTPGQSSKNIKTKVDIKEILDIGVNASCRYEHYRFHMGGEYGGFYGKIAGRQSYIQGNRNRDYTASIAPQAIDGHGYIDGTCNFYILANVGIKDSIGIPKIVPAALWLDEQEYFSERWHILDPRDNLFEGIGGALSPAFPVLTWFNGIDPDTLTNAFYKPYSRLTQNARMATSGTAIVIADDDTIYSTSYLWAITDGTWRWRNYPKLDSGETIDKQSVKIRDDMTVYFNGKKNVGNTSMEGYWYQQYLGPDNQLKGDPVYGGKPAKGYMHRWNFMGKEAFDYVDKNFYKTGMYDTTKWIASDSGQHYCYKGYFPHTNILKFNASDMLVSNTITTKGIITHHAAWKEFSVADLVDKKCNTIDAYSFDKYDEYYVLNMDGSYMYHPMYRGMKSEYQKPIVLKFVNINHSYYAHFLDPRNDDIDLSKTSFKILPKNSHDGKWYSIKANQPTNLNVWADLPIKFLQVKYNAKKRTISCLLFLQDANKYGTYFIKSFKVGCIEDSKAKILVELKSANIMPTIVNRSNRVAFLLKATDFTDSDWQKYFSSYGRAKYGTSVWVEDAFGNSNAVSNLTIITKGVKNPAPKQK